MSLFSKFTLIFVALVHVEYLDNENKKFSNKFKVSEKDHIF